jgi:hypothetical protein
MNNDKFEEVVNKQLKICKNILLERAGVYSTEKDRLSNFKQIAGMRKITPEEACISLVSKHIVALSDFSKNPSKVPYSQFEEKITDTINYMLLLKAIVDGRMK